MGKNHGTAEVNGTKFSPLDFVRYRTVEEIDEAFNETDYQVLWNTPLWFDLWLMKNCPLQPIQDRLAEQYDEKLILEVKAGTSVYDKYERNGRGKDIHFTIKKRPSVHWRVKNDWWYISVENSYDWSFGDDGKWYDQKCPAPVLCNWLSSDAVTKNLTVKKLARLLRKWDLPAGLEIRASSRYTEREYLIITK